MPPVARTPAQRGAVGNWLVDSRLARGYVSQNQARREIERLTGWRIAQSVYAEWESGRRVPEGDNYSRLQDFYGPMPEAPIGQADAVAAAIQRQAEAINRLAAALEGREKSARQWEATLVRALRVSMEERRGQGEVVLERLGELAAALGLEGTPTGDGLDTPERAN